MRSGFTAAHRGQTETEDESSSKPGGAGSIIHPSMPPLPNVSSPAEPSASSAKGVEHPTASKAGSLRRSE
eukprot:scaffold220784_cov32-Tisochrysis_lutea.AAC.7